MTVEKSGLPDNIRTLELPPAVYLTCEGIAANLLLNYKTEQKIGLAPLSFTPHDHAAYELFIIEEGELNITVEGKELNVKEGELLIVAPHTLHELSFASPNLRRFSLRFTLVTSNENAIAPHAPYLHDKLDKDELRFIFDAIKELYDISHKDSTRLTVFREKSLLGIIFSYILERLIKFDIQPHSKSVTHLQLLTKIENYLYLNYNQPITLDSLASHLSYSRTQMRRLMDECYGVPFTDKLREIRLAAARRYLTEVPTRPIEEIAAKCGYETRQGFESMFLKFVGMTPNQYRKAYKK